MVVLLINDNGASFVDIANTTDDINKALQWDDAWNTPTLKVRGVPFVFICSDTGKMRHERVSAISYSNLIAPKTELIEPFLVGSIIITKFNGIDDFEALNNEDIEILKSRLYTHGKSYLKDYYKTIIVVD